MRHHVHALPLGQRNRAWIRLHRIRCRSLRASVAGCVCDGGLLRGVPLPRLSPVHLVNGDWLLAGSLDPFGTVLAGPHGKPGRNLGGRLCNRPGCAAVLRFTVAYRQSMVCHWYARCLGLGGDLLLRRGRQRNACQRSPAEHHAERQQVDDGWNGWTRRQHCGVGDCERSDWSAVLAISATGAAEVNRTTLVNWSLLISP